MTIACEHCPNPNKADLNACRFVGSWSSREAFVASTFDPPCICDAYDEEQRARERRTRNFLIGVVLFQASVFAGVWFVFGR